MKKCVLLLIFSLGISIITPSYAALYEKPIQDFKDTVNHLVKCIQGHQDCSPLQIKASRLFLVIIGIVFAIGTSKLIYARVAPSLNDQLFDAACGHQKIRRTAAALIEQGADVNSSGPGGETPLMRAVKCNKPKLVQLFLEKGAHVNARDNAGETALYKAAEKESLHILNALRNAGADINAQNNQGSTPLMHAIDKEILSMDNRAIINELIQYANINLKDNEGNTALHKAIPYNHIPVVQSLLAAHPDVNAQNTKGWTPLMSATDAGFRDITKALLDAGANVHIRDTTNQSALDVANKPSVIDMLKAAGAQ